MREEISDLENELQKERELSFGLQKAMLSSKKGKSETVKKSIKK